MLGCARYDQSSSWAILPHYGFLFGHKAIDFFFLHDHSSAEDSAGCLSAVQITTPIEYLPPGLSISSTGRHWLLGRLVWLDLYIPYKPTRGSRRPAIHSCLDSISRTTFTTLAIASSHLGHSCGFSFSFPCFLVCECWKWGLLVGGAEVKRGVGDNRQEKKISSFLFLFLVLQPDTEEKNLVT